MNNGMYYPVYQNAFISVRNEMEARNYPVAYGNSVTFKDENAPYIYTKTMISQLEAPRFDKYRLVKEEANPPQTGAQSNQTMNLSSEEFKGEFEAIWKEIKALKEKVGEEDE